MTKFSIIIPIYNVEAYLGACLDSVVAQTHTDWECLMVDDCSDDCSRAVAQRYLADPRFRLLTTDRNSGPSVARNMALDAARGEYMVFVDSDDTIASDCLEAFAAYPGADVIAGSFAGTSGTGSTLTGREAALQMLYQRGINCSSSGKAFARRLFDENRYREDTLYEDLDLIPRIMLQARQVCLIDRQVYFYRQRPGSIMHTFGSQRLNVLDVTARMERDFAGDPELLAAARDRRLSANFNMYLLITRHCGRTPEADECWHRICRLRRQSLFNPRVRLKNKLGILLSYLGRPALTLAARLARSANMRINPNEYLRV